MDGWRDGRQLIPIAQLLLKYTRLKDRSWPLEISFGLHKKNCVSNFFADNTCDTVMQVVNVQCVCKLPLSVMAQGRVQHMCDW